jgi:hypothetical protein
VHTSIWRFINFGRSFWILYAKHLSSKLAKRGIDRAKTCQDDNLRLGPLPVIIAELGWSTTAT